MNRTFLRSKALLLCLISWAAVAAAPVPTFMFGNWLSTDGSNRFILGISPNVVNYRNSNWRVRSAEEIEDGRTGHWQISLERPAGAMTLDLYRKDSGLVLIEGRGPCPLSSRRTYDYRFRPKQESFRSTLFAGGMVQLKGYIYMAGNSRPVNYATVSYDNPLSGEKDYFFSDIDSLGCFSLRLPVNRPQFCTLNLGGDVISTFLVQPGDTLLLAYNPGVAVSGDNPNYSKLMQCICLMGDEAAFNNEYQHFLRYSVHLGYPDFKAPASTEKNISADVRKQQVFSYYNDLYATTTRAIDRVYPSSRVSRLFIDYIKADLRYSCARSLLDNLRPQQYGNLDSLDLRKVYNEYLAQQAPVALLHDSYYQLAALYASRLKDLRQGNSFTFTIPFGKVDERIKNDYGPLLSGNFLEIFREMQKDMSAVRGMKEDTVIEKYFHGDRGEAANFRYIYDKITSELYKEARDSAAYRVYAGIQNPCLRFAANLQQLFNSGWSDDIRIVSLYRLAIFRYYSSLPGMPLGQVDSINMRRTLLMAASNLQLRGNDKHITQIDHESEWQAALRGFRGRAVVIWTFPNYFDKERTARSLYELHKMQERYRGKDLVFIKCIQQRQRQDRVRQLVEYLKIMGEQGDLKDIFYMDQRVSPGVMMMEAIDDRCAIYDETGRPHHPWYYTRNWKERERPKIILTAELDSVLAGHGRYYEEHPQFFQRSSSTQGRITRLGDKDLLKSWTLYDSTGHYFSYTAGEPDKPVYNPDYDSVYHCLRFLKDSAWGEYELILHQQQTPKGNNSFYRTPDYSKEYVGIVNGHTFSFTGQEKSLKVVDGQKKLYRQFRLVFLTADFMVLELIQ